MYISVSTPYYSSLCVTCRAVYLHRSILHSELHVDQCIYTVLFFTLCYMQISVSTPYYSSLCFNVDQCIYSLLFFALCFL